MWLRRELWVQMKVSLAVSQRFLALRELETSARRAFRSSGIWSNSQMAPNRVGWRVSRRSSGDAWRKPVRVVNIAGKEIL